MGIVSEDGTVVGSIDVNQLDEIDPKTDEARAQLETLKAERDAGQEQAVVDADAKAAQERAQAEQSGQLKVEDQKANEQKAREQQKAADEKKAADQKASEQKAKG